MNDQKTTNPLTQLANAIRKIDNAMDDLKRAEEEMNAVSRRLAAAKLAAETIYQPASMEAARRKVSIPSAYHYSTTLVRFDEEGICAIERLEVGSTFELDRFAEQAVEDERE